MADVKRARYTVNRFQNIRWPEDYVVLTLTEIGILVSASTFLAANLLSTKIIDNQVAKLA